MNIEAEPSGVYMASCFEPPDGCGTVGTVSYSYFDGVNTFQAVSVGDKDNGMSGINWWFAPGTDTDGDKVEDGADPCPEDAVNGC